MRNLAISLSRLHPRPSLTIGLANGTWRTLLHHHNENQEGLQKPKLEDVFPKIFFLCNNEVVLQLHVSFETLVLDFLKHFVFFCFLSFLFPFTFSNLLFHQSFLFFKSNIQKYKIFFFYLYSNKVDCHFSLCFDIITERGLLRSLKEHVIWKRIMKSLAIGMSYISDFGSLNCAVTCERSLRRKLLDFGY
jgi:hypothetical protein